MTPPPHPLVFVRGLLKERRIDAWQDWRPILTVGDADTIRGLKYAGEVWVQVHHLYKGSSQDWFQGEMGREPTVNEMGIIDEIVKEGNDALGVK